MKTAKSSHPEQTISLLMSAPRSRYMKTSAELNHFLDWLIDSAIELDRAVTKNAQLAWRSGKVDKAKVRKELALGAGALRKIRVFYRLITEMALCRAVDSYLTYVTELLTLIFRSKPESLRSGQQVKLDFVLAYPTRAGLLKAIVEREVNQLSYQGMRELERYLSSRLGLELFRDDKGLERAILLIEIRNTIVHARGIVSGNSVLEAADPPVSRGKRIELTIAEVSQYIKFLTDSVSDIEWRAHEKFGVKLPHKVPGSLVNKKK